MQARAVESAPPESASTNRVPRGSFRRRRQKRSTARHSRAEAGGRLRSSGKEFMQQMKVNR